ncbi:MAG: hypothetical protein KAY32_10405 [Candidatus Eisenbacteria sp.]|nr:hypothetical protein [Candidatus Eisenbacteria bacterium]
MRPVRTILSLAESTFQAKVLHLELTEEVFEHQRLVALTSHVHKAEQEGYVPDFSAFVGQTVTIEIEDQSVAPEDSPGPQTIFSGTVAEVRLVYEPNGLKLEFHASSGSAALDAVPRARIFQETTLGSLVDELLADHLGSGIEAANVQLGALANKQISFAAQWNETDWQFLLRLCRKFGLLLAARSADLHIHAVNPFSALTGLESPIDLKLGHDLWDFSIGLRPANRDVRASSYQYFGEQGLDAGSADQAEDVRTWAGPSEDSPPTSTLAQQAAAAGTTSGSVVETDDHFSQQEFDAIAGRWGQVRVARMIAGSGQCDAIGVGLGALLHIAPAATRSFDALQGERFFVTRARHTLLDGVYAIAFETAAEGAPPLLAPALTAGEPDTRLLAATVTDSCDPSNVGRVKVRLNAFGDDALTEEIPARCLTEASGESHGTLNLPEIGDEVLLVLDPRAFAAPPVLGSLYNGASKALVADLPEHTGVDAGELANNNIKYYLSKNTTCVIHDVTSEGARLTLSTPSISVVLSEQADTSLDIQVRDSATMCQILGTKSGDLTIKAKNIAIEAEEGITVKAGQNIEIESDQKTSAKASEMEFEAQGNIKAEASMNMELKGGMDFKAEGGMNCNLKGMMLKAEGATTAEVSGGAMLTLKGGMVMIN